MPTDDREPLLALATDLATRAAQLLVDGLGRARLVIDTKSTATDMVTEMDRASEALIVDGITAARPDDAIVAEEGTALAGGTGVRWVVDPLDGTTNYLYGYPGFAVSIGVEIDAVAEVAAVADPLHRDLFTAVRGRGAWRNGEPISVTGEADLARALVGTGFAYDPDRRLRQGAVVAKVLPLVRDVRRSGAASIDLCSVAAGRLDAYYERGLAPWDFSAGALVAREAGALTEDLDGNPPSWDFTLAAGPALFEPMRRLLAEAGAREA